MSNREPLNLGKLTERDFPFIKKLSHEQEDMVIKLFKSKRVIVDAIAGSGKTTITAQAMKVLKDKGHINKVFYVVFPVQEGGLGYLPGDLPKKLMEYAVPFAQALAKAGVTHQELDVEAMCNPLMPGDYKVVSHTFLRGRTYDDIGVIVDEIQNGKPDEIVKTLTRLEDDCYIAMIGHNGQIDIPKHLSGFSPLIHHFKEGKRSGIYTDFEFAELTHNFRGEFSSFVDQMSKAFAKMEPEHRGPVKAYAAKLEQ